jgi:hypothetical protein
LFFLYPFTLPFFIGDITLQKLNFRFPFFRIRNLWVLLFSTSVFFLLASSEYFPVFRNFVTAAEKVNSDSSRYDNVRKVLDESKDDDDYSLEHLKVRNQRLRDAIDASREDSSDQSTEQAETEDAVDTEEDGLNVTRPKPVDDLCDTAKELMFSDKSYYINDKKGNGKFHAAFVSVPWDGFSSLAEYCEDNDLELRLEFFPLMNMFELGKCKRVKRSQAPDGGWVYDFVWIPNNGKGEEQVLLTVKLSETEITAEQKECLDSTLEAKKAIRALEYIRMGVLRWSFVEKDTKSKEEVPESLTFATQLFAPVDVSDVIEPSPQAISIGEKLRKFDVLSDMNFDAKTDMVLELASCRGLTAVIEGGVTTFSELIGALNYQNSFALQPTKKNSDDRQLITIALINGIPANEYVDEFFNNSGAIEMAYAQIGQKELEIAAFESQYVAIPNISSSDPKENQRIFSERKRLEKINHNIDRRIQKLNTQIGRINKSLDIQRSKLQKKNIAYFQNLFSVTYKVFLTNKAVGPDKFLLCDSFVESHEYDPRDDEHAGDLEDIDIFNDEDIKIDLDGDDSEETDSASDDDDADVVPSKTKSSSKSKSKSDRSR